MKFFTTFGNFLSDHLLAAVVWLVLINLALYALSGEDENRAAHKKPRYPFVLLLIVALLGGAAGGMIWAVRYAKKGWQKTRGNLWLILALLQEILVVYSVCRADRTFKGMLSGVGGDFLAALSWVHSVFGGAKTFILILLGVMSLLSFIVFGFDKHLAVKSKGRRVSEAVLITLTALGGALGSLLAMLTFRHKTRHAKFTVTVPVCLCVQLFLLAGILIG